MRFKYDKYGKVKLIYNLALQHCSWGYPEDILGNYYIKGWWEIEWTSIISLVLMELSAACLHACYLIFASFSSRYPPEKHRLQRWRKKRPCLKYFMAGIMPRHACFYFCKINMLHFQSSYWNMLPVFLIHHALNSDRLVIGLAYFLGLRCERHMKKQKSMVAEWCLVIALYRLDKIFIFRVNWILGRSFDFILKKIVSFTQWCRP